MSPPWLFLEEEYNEYCASGDLGLGAPDLGAGVGLELTWLGEDFTLSDVSLGLGAELGIGEVEIEAGTGGLQGMLYYESPGPVTTKAGVGLELSSDEHKYLKATQAQVNTAGGYQAYGKREIGPDFVFVGVELEAPNETQLDVLWWGRYCTRSYEACRQTRYDND